MKWIKGLLLGLLLLIGLPLVMAILISRTSSDQKTFQLQDGKQLRIEQFTHGQMHRFGPPAPIGALKQILPSLPILPFIQHHTGPDSLVMWLTLEDPEQEMMIPLTNVVKVIAKDKQGSRYISNEIETRDEKHWRTQPSWGGPRTPPPTSKWFISHVTLAQYPKGEEQFDVDLVDWKGNTLQTITINNPKIIQPKDWQSSPLPEERTQEEVTVRLTNFTNTWTIRNIGQQYGEIPRFTSNFEFLSNGQPDPNWRYDSGRAEDTFGNMVAWSGFDSGNLSLQSEAWKITYDFYLADDAPFPPEQIWELTLEIPEEGKSKSLNLEKEMIGLNIKLLNITGPHTKAVFKEGKLQSAELAKDARGSSLSSRGSYTGGKFVHTVTYRSDNPYIGVHFPEDYHKNRIRILAKNDKGVFLPLSSHSRSTNHHFIGIREDQIAPKLDIKVIVQPVFQESFFVKPAIYPPVHQFKKAKDLPDRSQDAPNQTIDLSDYYTQNLNQYTHIHGRIGTRSYGASFNFRGVKPGVHRINQQDWDLRGVVLMTGTCLYNAYLEYPEKMEDIRIGTKASKVHFLHGCLWPGEAGKIIGRYIVYYADGTSQSIPLVYEQNTANIWDRPNQVAITAIDNATLVELPINGNANAKLSYHFSWENPNPDQVIEHIAIESNRKESAPVLLGITLEP